MIMTRRRPCIYMEAACGLLGTGLDRSRPHLNLLTVTRFLVPTPAQRIAAGEESDQENEADKASDAHGNAEKPAAYLEHIFPRSRCPWSRMHMVAVVGVAGVKLAVGTGGTPLPCQLHIDLGGLNFGGEGGVVGN